MAEAADPEGAVPEAASSEAKPLSAYRHLILVIATASAIGSSVVQMGVPFLIPAFHSTGMSLATAGLIAAMPAAGIVLTLIAWGWVVDTYGERFAMTAGLAGTAVGTCAAGFASRWIETRPWVLALALLVAGCFAASVNSAGGRVVSGWYPAHQRGMAMGIRQMAQPLGVALSAATLPMLALQFGIEVALFAAAGLAGVLALVAWIGIRDPQRPESGSKSFAAAARNPYRESRFLLRLHISSAMLSWPQSMMAAFILVWLLQRGYDTHVAGLIVMFAQIVGALSRAGLGVISDRVHSRILPYRHVATATLVFSLAAMMAELLLGSSANGAGDAASNAPSITTGLVLATLCVCALSISAVSPNGLAFTAVAESAGPLWSGRAMGAQNTFQNVVYAATPPIAGLVVTHSNFAVLFGITALFPLASLLVAPRADAHKDFELD